MNPLDLHTLDQKSYAFQEIIGQPQTRFPGNLRDFVSVKDSLFGAKGNGTTDDSTAIMAASLYAVSNGGAVFFPRGTYLVKSTLALTSAYNNLKWFGFGDNQSIIKKGFNGSLITVTTCSGFEMHDMHLYGDQNSFTGKGVVFSGASHYPYFPGTVLEGFQSTFIEFGADSGYSFSCPSAKFYLDRTNAQSALSMIVQSADDTGASHKHFVDVHVDGDFDLSGSLATIISGSRFRNLITTNNTSVLMVCGNSWAMTGGSGTANAINMTIVGNRIGGNMTLGTGSSGSYVGNHPTAGTLTNSAAVGNWVVLHHDGASKTIYVNQHLLDVQDTVANTIQACRCTFTGDADMTFTVGTTGNRIFYQTPLTAGRTVTLSTTGAKNGDIVTVARQAAATGASTLTVGAKTLAVGQWVEYTFDSSSWQLTAFGSL